MAAGSEVAQCDKVEYENVFQHENFRKQQADKIAEESGVYFLKQTASNSCGTIALLHTVANNKGKFAFGECVYIHRRITMLKIIENNITGKTCIAG